MKRKLILGLLALTICVGISQSLKSITFAWNYDVANESPDLVFQLRYSATVDAPIPWPIIATIPGSNRTYTVSLPPGRGYYYLTAGNIWGESEPSNMVTTPPPPQSNLGLTVGRAR